MNQTRKLTAIWLLLSLLLTACQPAYAPSGQKDQTSVSDQADQDPQEEETFKVGVCIFRENNNFMDLYQRELEQYLTETYEARVWTAYGEDDQETQNQQISGFIADGADALIVDLVDPDAAASVADQCTQADIPVVFINREPDEEEIMRWKQEKIRASYVGADARQSGTYQGEIVIETFNHGDFNRDKTISYFMLMGEENNVDTRYRSLYAVKALKDAGYNVHELYKGYGDWTEENGYELTASALLQYKDQVEVIFCNNDAMAYGAQRALQEAGLKVGRDVCLVGVDALEKAVEDVKNGALTGTILNDHAGQSHLAADIAVKMHKGGRVDPYYAVDYIKIAK